ncbi:MAG: gliding motility-associated C-terminal domain-containing protein [Chitinophagaceae bacterium]|nr:gliding motility-associated C-terminal domain-containing protein [Chitinophagaceae bacterium]
MKKLILFFAVAFFCGQASFGAHLKGGWIQYTYLGPGASANTSKYQITVRQYLSCNSTAMQRDADVYLGIFNGSTNQLITTLTVNRTSTETTNKTTYSPCLSTKPPVCYIIDVYSTTIDLPNTAGGYTLTVQRCCRIVNIANLSSPSDDYGISYTARIPGTISGNTYFNNSSPVFAQKDTVVVCYSSPFSLDFSAKDADGDSLSYMFCSGLHGGFNNRNDPSDPQASRPNPPANPPYTEIVYSNGYSGSSPLGSRVSIDVNTGIISGIAPDITGDYVIAVCVNEFRNGIQISSTKKEIHVAVANCTVSAASLKPTYITCNGTKLTFENQSTSSNIISYAWDFGVPNLTSDTSSSPSPTYDFLQSGKDSGTYTVKLKVASASGCQDSTTARVLVYPGFKADFTVTGTCFLNAYLFKDATTSKYGTVNSWRWNFGDSTTLADTARSKDSAWKYASARNVQATLITTNSKGCIDTAVKTLSVLDRPKLNLPFKDTLICSIDTLMLKVNIASGTVLWTPASGPNQNRILNATTATPLVFPTDTTKYYVAINDNGCANTDTVTVNVLKLISVDVRDTGICRTDTFRLRPTSDALSYKWSSSNLNEKIDNTKNPLVQPMVNTQYNVLANLGKCQARDSMQVTVQPYPTASAGSDVTICYGTRVQLGASIVGSVFFWSPTSSLMNENTLTPIAGPTKTTAYVLTATNNVGCLKPKTDTIVVTVIPPVNANAGHDTTVLPGQPVQLQASGGVDYAWRPVTGLNNPFVDNPIATLDNTIDSIVYTVRVNDGACYAEDQVTVHVLRSGSDILVPSGFTPNGDGKNDVIRPALFGISKFGYFSVYNRWGQLLYSTPEIGKGWDGNFAGIAQAPGTYVYQTLGYDLQGNRVYRKGTFVLIR